jgi:vacuolar-type H+-ATPase subunit E/Vma4
MTIGPLLSRLEQDSDDEAGRRLADARAEAEALLASTDARLARHRQEQLADAAAALAHERERALGVARQRASELTLRARERFVARAFAVARRRASGDRSLGLVRLRARCDAGEALSFLPAGPALIRCLPALASSLRPVVESVNSGHSVAIVEDASLSPGIVAETPDGRLRVDLTFDHRLNAAATRAAIWLVRQVEGGAT